MTEVARALVLPDLDRPSPALLRNLTIYWDEVVCPVYREAEYFDAEDPLYIEGVVREISREIAPDRIFPVADSDLDLSKEKNWGYAVHRNDEDLPTVELIPLPATPKKEHRPLRELSDAELEDLTAISFGQHLGYVDDALAIAGSNNFAPVSHSLAGHLATVIGSSQAEPDVPSREAALLSVVIEAFAIDPQISSEDILRFREKSSRARARLRASLVDLSAHLQSEKSPIATLAEARDAYRNRVEPALGDLEEVLKENQLKFFTKSLVGATAVAIAPVEPVSTSVGAARMMGQTIDYAYSKSRLLREHPYGYLHQVRQGLGVTEVGNSSGEEVESIMMAPRESLWRLWLDDWKLGRESQRMRIEREKS